MRSPLPIRRVKASYRPHLLPLEERLPLGDGVLGVLTSLALLPTPAAPALLHEPSTAISVGRIFNPSGHADGLEIRPTESRTAASGSAATALLAAPTWDALANLFAPVARRQQSTFSPSPQRQQGSEVSPSLALRVGDEPLTPHPRATAPAVVAATPHSDGALLATLVGMRASDLRATSGATPTQEARVKENFGKLPLYFEENVGQTDASVHYFTRGPGYGLYLTGTEAVMVLSPPKAAQAVGQDSNPVHSLRQDWNPVPQAVEAPPAVVRMQLVGANATPTVTGRDEQPGKVNYFLGNDPTKWHTNIATFARVEYDDVYPGIDLVWHGGQQQLEYDFVVTPGADPSVIHLNVSGAERLEIDAAGDLVVQAGGQELRQHKPFVYQEMGDTRREVASRFVLDGQQVRFAVGAYDAGRPLVIDPVLGYSTYLGGSGSDQGNGLAVDPASGDALVTGWTTSTDFPTANPLQASYRGLTDVFVTRLNAAGSALVFSTYLGGSGTDTGAALAVDPASGDALLTGYTYSTNFPTANPLQAVNRGSADVFVARLSAAGSALVSSTYLGGSDQDFGTALAVDPATGDALLTGYTWSGNFPIANPLQATCGGCPNFSDGFVTRLNAAGSALVYSTYLGGSTFDRGRALAVDPATGDALVAGYTVSTNFPTANPLYASNRGNTDGFVARLNAAGSALVYSTYLGGSGGDAGWGLAVDPATGDALLVGQTSSTDFPTAYPLQASNRGLTDVFVTRLNASGSALVFSTYLGGSNDDRGHALAVDPATGDAVVTGQTSSPNFPTANPLQPALGGCGGIFCDAFVARLNAAGSALGFSTYLGGSGADEGYALAVNPVGGDTLVTGYTRSPNFPTAHPFQPVHGGASDAFVTRIGSSLAAYYYVYPDSGQVTAGVPFDFYVFALDAGFHVIPDYTGLILFWATDPQATTPVYYQYQRTDRGIASFPGGLTFNTPGVQELYVFDWPGVQVFGYAAFDVRP